MRILVTGGAGFIGSHTCDRLLAQGHRITVLDALTRPVHSGGVPAYLASDIEFYEGDVRNRVPASTGLPVAGQLSFF